MTSSPAHAPGVHRSRHTGSGAATKRSHGVRMPRPFCAAVPGPGVQRRSRFRMPAPESYPKKSNHSGGECPGERCVLLETGMRNVPHSGLQRAARSGGPGSRRRRNAERVAVSPPDATIGLPATGTGTTPGRDRPTVPGPAHTGRARRRDAGRRGRAGGLDARSRRGLLRALERWLALSGADPDERADAVAAELAGGFGHIPAGPLRQARSCALAIVACLRVAMVPQGILDLINVPCR